MSKTLELNEELLAIAKEKYMNYQPVSEIARDLNVNRTSLQYHVSKDWKTERILRRNELASELSESKAAVMSATFSASYKGVHAWVNKVTQPGYDLKPNEVKTLMQIISDMDKIVRLDQGTPTDIISETAPISVIEIRKKIMESDPFMLEDADFKEIENETSDS